MIVLGVDTGSVSLGYGVVLEEGNRLSALGYGAIRNKTSTPHPDRLLKIYRELGALIAHYKPQAMAIEDVFVSRNARSALKLGQVRGAAIVAAMQEGLAVLEFSPSEVKSAVTGYGMADKAQMQMVIKMILGLEAIPQPNDAADALALAICGLNRRRAARRAPTKGA
ncbi:MAG: crossover junction endodeoxyribonuclease RuvC [Acidobacteriota bacterium]|jgi:crossover junction endodeoxyribonuclease RuvC